ncbi:MAG: tetratricopeptide repeat protein [Acidobacteria bacterium]|nr:tetratricopeptide repeat protein [Acidobacteriota bacterium]
MNQHRLFTFVFAGLFVFACFTTSRAQTPALSPQMQAADALFTAQKWSQAIPAYEAITKTEPTNNRAWYRLAYALHSTAKYNEAIAAYQKIVATNNPSVLYNLARSYARLNHKEQAFAWLTKAVNAGFSQSAQLNNDADLASLRDDARFKELQTAIAKRATPCLYAPEHRQFDFWIGEWEVFTPPGQLAGTSSIQRVVDGCVIFENWTGAQGGNGKSFNFYDRNDGKWHQLWVGSNGGVINFSGAFKDDAMRYEAVTTTVNGSKTLQRMTFFKLVGDKVRQLWETSTDDGKTWSLAFDGTYVKKKS